MAYTPDATDTSQPADAGVKASTAAAEFRTLKAYIKNTLLGGTAVWTGTPSFQTQVAADNSLKAATTAFVQQELSRLTGMVVNVGGNVGIGVATPLTRLDVRGSGTYPMRVQGTTPAAGGGLQMFNDTSSYGAALLTYGSVYAGGSLYNVGANGSALIATGTNNSLAIGTDVGNSTGSLILGTNNSERMRIAATGDVLIGKTAAATTGAGCYFEPAAALGYGRLNFVKETGSGTGNSSVMSFYYSGTSVGSVQVSSTTTSFITSSDERLKANIVPAADGGALLDAMRVVSYDWKSSGEKVAYGVIAQELHEIFPAAVSVGDTTKEVEHAWGVDYSKLVPLLVKELQVLRQRVAQLEAA